MSAFSLWNKDSENLIDDLKFCVIDLETTGGNHKSDEIIEIGLVNVDGRKIISEKGFLINPGREIPDFIQKLTKIKNSDVAKAPAFQDIVSEVLDFIGDRILIAHNAAFDVPFLNAALLKVGQDELKNKVLCTNIMTKHLIPDIMNSNLNYMSQLFEIDHHNAHRATADAKATAGLLIIYLNLFIHKGIKKINQLYYPRNKFELDRIHLSKEDDRELIVKGLSSLKNPLIIVLKGDKGLIDGILPLENPSEEIEFVKKFLNFHPWERVTIKLTSNILEGLFEFDTHLMKYNNDLKEATLIYLKSRYLKSEEVSLTKLDFLIAPHLVKAQVSVYSFLNLNTNSHFIFKLPGHNKKMYQHLLTQIGRFEGNQKGIKKNSLHKEIIPLIEGVLARDKMNGKETYYFLERKDVKNFDAETLSLSIEKFLKKNVDQYNFPKESL